MKIIPFLFLFLFLPGAFATEDEKVRDAASPQKGPLATRKASPPSRPAPSKVVPLRPAIPFPRDAHPRLARWEYCILEISVRESQQKPGIFQLHMPHRSSGRSRDLAKIFREVHVQMAKTSNIDEINALNTLGALGWELVFSQKKDDAVGLQVFYYFKRRT